MTDISRICQYVLKNSDTVIFLTEDEILDSFFILYFLDSLCLLFKTHIFRKDLTNLSVVLAFC